MYFVTYNEEAYDSDLNECYDEERWVKFKTLDDAITFIKCMYSPETGVRYIRLWKADKISYNVELNVEIKE